ncbi:MAG: hypothetical protein QOJ14_216 [Thermoleophilaceae bacterium]|nr:hypothetical protein [Thermoleophilaceae bacterium]
MGPPPPAVSMSSFRRTTPMVVAALAVVLAVAAGSKPTRAAGGSAVDIYPVAGTKVANPRTTISFRGISTIPKITVTASRSGRHRGHFERHSDHRGATFIPDHAFGEGELVTVHSDTKLTRATSAGNVRFRIYSHPNPDDLRNAYGQLHKDPEGNPKEAQAFHTRKDLRPPDLGIDKRSGAASDDPLFYAVKGGPGQDGPQIRDSRGRLIWFRRIRPPLSPYDFRVQAYQGKPVLTWWQGRVLAGKGRGYGVILDSHYKLVKHVTAGNGYRMDQHEFELTPRGTAFINVYEPVRYSLKPIGGSKNGTVWDSIVQEIDIKTGLVLFEWHSLAHVSVRLGTFPVREGSGFPYDPFHVNSVSEDANGNLLLSARNTNALFLVNRHNGNVLSRIGGKKPDFTMGEGTNMIGQHQAVLQPDGLISVFDNGGSTQFPTTPDKESRGIFLKVNGGDNSVTLDHQYTHPGEHLFSRSQGSMQVLRNGNVFISWGGGNPYLTEFTRGGDLVFDSHIRPKRDDTYRAYRMPWAGARPTGRPNVVAFTGESGTNVYVSWNGSTDVARWEVLTGSNPDKLKSVGQVGWHDFETRIELKGASPKYVQVRALSGGGSVLGTSATIQPKRV